MRNCVYRFLDEDGNLLYIGKAKNLEERMRNHNHLPKECYNKRKTIEYVEFPTVEDMNIVERVLIAMLKPPYNTELKQNNITIHIMELSNLKWRIYDPECENILSVDDLADGTYLLEIINGKPKIIGELSKKITPKPTNNKQHNVFDELLEDAIEVIFKNQASASTLQRSLKIGFDRASRIIYQLEQLGIVSECDAKFKRKILIHNIDEAKKIANKENVE